jgi:hypothetical protein
MRTCSLCGHESPDEARYCFNPDCRSPLDPVEEGSSAPLPPPPPEDRRRLPGWAWGAGAAGIAAVVGGVVVAVGALSGGASKAAPTTAPTRAPATTVVASAPATTVAPTTTLPARGNPLPASAIVSAEASSTLPDQDGLTYGIANTLDGQITTGWNSNSSTPGSGVDPVGQKLDYKLASPQHIVGVRVINGFNPGDANHTFNDNARVKTLVLRAAGQEDSVDLADSFSPQFIEVDFPNADALELEVGSIYPGTKWKDVGITEVQIFVAGPPAS